jgi:predicted  nucleic acid-binding Zn-ribbon protein
LSWITDVWKIVEAVASLTKEVERANAEIKELRTDLNALTHSVSNLKADLAHEKETTGLVLDGYKNEVIHVKESIENKFEVLTTKLDSRVQDFEHRHPLVMPELAPRGLKPKSEN